VRLALKDMHFLAYPSTFTETCCLSAVEAMAAGCRVVVPTLGALAETTAGFARMYPHNADKSEHAALFADALHDEFRNPWQGDLSQPAFQQDYCRRFYDWDSRAQEWRRLIEDLTGRPIPARRPRTARPAPRGVLRRPASPPAPA
jgi:glycosyltransferase involved in cell wall biosynthesis